MKKNYYELIELMSTKVWIAPFSCKGSLLKYIGKLNIQRDELDIKEKEVYERFMYIHLN